ncbi:Transmembrane and coiled-coil domains protein 1 [Halotydeus destructor]|nr:Transmembrane and coiled-coil domains protein 1 [Halotydeus destructor]
MIDANENDVRTVMDLNQSQQLTDSSKDEFDALVQPSAAVTSDSQRTRSAIDHIEAKIERTKEAVKKEQTARDENVNEYLKLSSAAVDKTQITRIKSIFEKKNQKSAQTISHLQKKLDSYSKRIKELEQYGYSALHQHRPKDMLRDMGHGLKGVGTNIKEGITGITSGIKTATYTAGEAVMNPTTFLRTRFGSSDNLSGTERSVDEGSGDHENVEGNSKFYSSTNNAQSHSRSSTGKFTSDEESSSITSDPNGAGKPDSTLGGGAPASVGHSSASPLKRQRNTPLQSMSRSNEVVVHAVDLEPVLKELAHKREEVARLTEEVDSMKAALQAESTIFHQSLQEERYRFERLEEQMNDLIELHQNEIENLKTGITDMEEKVQYQSEERLRDVHEMLESCQTRISRMEHQQHQHLQQLVNLDSLENTNARALVLKLINIVLTILQVVLLLVATVANILSPFLHSRLRMIITAILVGIAIAYFRNQNVNDSSYSNFFLNWFNK